MFDHVATADITLINNGKVGFDFCCLNMDPALAKKPKPGVPVMVPHAVSSYNVIRIVRKPEFLPMRKQRGRSASQ